jgi:hypothetical protein
MLRMQGSSYSRADSLTGAAHDDYGDGPALLDDRHDMETDGVVMP